MSHCITVLPEKLRIEAENGETPLSVRRTAGLIPGAPCGGEDRCGKNRVFADGADVISRIPLAAWGQQENRTNSIRCCLETRELGTMRKFLRCFAGITVFPTTMGNVPSPILPAFCFRLIKVRVKP